MVLEIYKRHKERWFLAEVYDELLRWNRWWPGARDTNGLLAWGSDNEPQLVDGTFPQFSSGFVRVGARQLAHVRRRAFQPANQPTGNGRRWIECAVRGRLPRTG